MPSAMYETTIGETAGLIRETAVTIAWHQWAALGAGALGAPGRRAGAIVDPEALVLLSLVMEPAERRLADFVAWWARVGSPYLNVQRTRTLLKHFPPEAADGLKGFARQALDAGDPRWRPHAGNEAPTRITRRPKGPEAPRLTDPPALMLRLRAGFGVNAKADALTFLLGTAGASATATDVAEAIGYSTVAVRNALTDMARARVLQEVPGRPAAFFVYPAPWAHLLGRTAEEGPGAWVWWLPVEAFLAHAWVLFEEAAHQESSAYRLSSCARDLAGRFAAAFLRNRIPVPHPSDHPGADYLGAFHESVRVVKKWAERALGAYQPGDGGRSL